MSNPNQTVAARIIAAFEANDILRATSTKGLLEKLAAGRISSSEWITLFGLDAKSRNENAKDKTQKH